MTGSGEDGSRQSPDDFDVDAAPFDPATVNLAEMFPATPEAQEIVDRMRTPLAPGDPRLHHYVPQWWLRRFADADERVVAVPLIDSGNPRPPTKVDSVAAIRDFNTADDVDVGPSVAVERLLAKVDGEAARPVDRLATGVLFPPVPRDRVAIATWLGMQFVRGPTHRRHHEALTDFAYKAELSLVNDEDTAHAFLEARGINPTPEATAKLLEFVGDMDDIEVTTTHSSAVKSMLDMGLRLFPVFHARRLLVVKFDEPGLAQVVR